jgi:hypothetical protein
MADGKLSLVTLRLLQHFCLLDHGRGQVDAGDMASDLGKRTGHQAGTARHVQHGVLWPDTRSRQEKFWGMILQLRKRHRLLGELLQNQPLMLVGFVGDDPPMLSLPRF